MKTAAIALVLASFTAYAGWLGGSQIAPPPPEPRAEIAAPVAPELPDSPTTTELLKRINVCVDELFPEHVGAGGNKLRFDSMKIEPYSPRFTQTGAAYAIPDPDVDRFFIRIEEEHPHRTVPSGVYFAMTPAGDCGYLLRD